MGAGPDPGADGGDGVTAVRHVLWRGLDTWHAESCAVRVTARGLTAEGVQLGTDPVPYRLDYALEAGEGFTTRLFEATASGDGWTRRLRLEREGTSWTCAAEATGAHDLGAPGCDPADLAEATECDLGLSPLTNSTPILRGGLHRGPGSVEIVAAWVSVPELTVRPSRQRYDHVAPGVVRYTDLGLFPGFTEDVAVDGDGLVTRYPGLAVAAGPREPA